MLKKYYYVKGNSLDSFSIHEYFPYLIPSTHTIIYEIYPWPFFPFLVSFLISASHIVRNLLIYLLRISGLLSPDGLTKSFDNAADGYTRSEGITVLFLQKARDAKRIYAEIKSVRSSYGPTHNRLSVLYPTQESQTNIMKETLKESGISGKDISFVEADGSGIKDADAEEVKAIDQVYNEGRKSPLLIGSIKSNIGSCSASNPLNSIIKVKTHLNSFFIKRLILKFKKQTFSENLDFFRKWKY